MIDDDLDTKIRLKQAKTIEQTKSTTSYSKIINQVIRKGFR